jgi:two-component system, NtrC family, sensor kinase
MHNIQPNPPSPIADTAETQQAEMFRRLVEEAHDVLGVWGLDGIITYLSPSFQVIFGHAVADWIGQSFVPLVHTEDVSTCMAANQYVAESGEKFSGIEFRHRHIDGHWCWVAISISPIKDEEETVVALQGILRDISDRKALETTLLDAADRQILLNQLAKQIRRSLDLETVVATAVEAIRELLNIDACAFAWYEPQLDQPSWTIIQESKQPEIPPSVGRHPAALVGPVGEAFSSHGILRIDDASQYQEPIHRAFLHSIHCQSELLLPIHTKAQIGVIICLHYSQVRPWTDDEVELLESVSDQLAIAIEQAKLYAESRTQSQVLQQTLKELRQTQSQLIQNEKMSSLGQLVAGIAHEINNPVNFIHGNLDYVRNYAQEMLELIELHQKDTPDAKGAIAQKMMEIDLDFINEDLPKLLTSMQGGTERIREIVKSLRLFSRLDEAEVKPVDIHDGIDSALMILDSRLKATSYRGEIQVIKAYGQLPLVQCFAGQMNQVFMNILMNAIDALDATAQNLPIDQQHRSLTIHITTLLTPTQQVNIRIADNGIGIPTKIQAQVFDPFFTTKAVGKGTGLGLSVSYQIITEQHGGQLWCESAPGAGTQFVIEIPEFQATALS